MSAFRLAGTLELDFQRHPLSLGGQFHLAGLDEPARPTGRRTVTLVASAALVLPAFVALAAGFLRAQLGYPALFDLVSSTPSLSLLVVLSIFIGAPAAVLLILLPIVEFGLTRRSDGFSAKLALRPDPVQLVILLTAIAVVGVFFGHLIADQFACWRGVKSAC